MGAVSIDIHRKEREFEQLTLSDGHVVKYLILYRSKVDVSYGANVNINIQQAGDVFEFNQELISLYTSLDILIESIRIKEKDREFLRLIFEGHEVADIIDVYGYPRKTAYRTLKRIVDKLVEANYISWQVAMDKQGLQIKEEIS